MAKRNSRNTRGRIISAAWKLFYEQGYDGTTVEDIVFESGTSKGSFYHYFDGKDALMGTLAYVFDEKYEDLMPTLDPEKGAIETLAYINHELYVMIESSVSIDLLTRLLSTQLLARGEKHLLVRSGANSAPVWLRRRSSGPSPCGSGHSFTTGVCAVETILWWPTRRR